MKYESTRGNSPAVFSSEAIKMGIAPDGGLFVPLEKVIFTDGQLQSLTSLSYTQRAVSILKSFLTDFTLEELTRCVEAAYGGDKFDAPGVAPVKSLTPDTAVLELWHGPTCAFKDMALQILPQFLVRAMQKTGEISEIVILVATSGDTGKAALDGFADVPGTSIIVFFPEQGVSEVQRLQMVTQKGKNVHVIGVRGNFDDAQSGVKQVFGDKDLSLVLAEKGYRLSSANSINWGRLVPQIVYYFSAYADLVKAGTIQAGEKINFVVPTGNFGNILAGFYAKAMGLPVNRLICAANANNVLTDFIQTGHYDRNRKFFKTLSPSMDILISSNLERLLYELTGRQADKINRWMTELKTRGAYTVDQDTREKVRAHFWSDFADDRETLDTIKETWEQHRYLLDTHTAVAVRVLGKYRQATGDTTYSVVASTASPFKFNGSVAKALLGDEGIAGKSEFELLNDLSAFTGWPIPKGLRNLDKRPVLHKGVTDKDKIDEAVRNILLRP
ncbi:threonine synthase [Desulforamulus putei]|uniref:Threonine synthase n=1 Tax=Desulforamulus putei DSM 12395 TaxID=1121429 RepID=A0A1M4VS31_9FIRM|nr:threonine synthase [Desulforamulus putei]SHE71769.1 L-threonine synthase [Desulforamulus putei DSM 12395]